MNLTRHQCRLMPSGVVTEGVHVVSRLPNNDCFQGSQLCLYVFSDQNENIWPFQIFVCSFVTFPKEIRC